MPTLFNYLFNNVYELQLKDFSFTHGLTDWVWVPKPGTIIGGEMIREPIARSNTQMARIDRMINQHKIEVIINENSVTGSRYDLRNLYYTKAYRLHSIETQIPREEKRLEELENLMFDAKELEKIQKNIEFAKAYVEAHKNSVPANQRLEYINKGYGEKYKAGRVIVEDREGILRGNEGEKIDIHSPDINLNKIIKLKDGTLVDLFGNLLNLDGDLVHTRSGTVLTDVDDVINDSLWHKYNPLEWLLNNMPENSFFLKTVDRIESASKLEIAGGVLLICILVIGGSYSYYRWIKPKYAEEESSVIPEQESDIPVDLNLPVDLNMSINSDIPDNNIISKDLINCISKNKDISNSQEQLKVLFDEAQKLVSLDISEGQLGLVVSASKKVSPGVEVKADILVNTGGTAAKIGVTVDLIEVFDKIVPFF